MAHKNLDTLRRGCEFVHRAEHDPAHPQIIKNGGSHVKVTTRRGMVVIPVHPGELHHGLLCAIRKQWVAIGLTVLACCGVLAAELAF